MLGQHRNPLAFINPSSVESLVSARIMQDKGAQAVWII